MSTDTVVLQRDIAWSLEETTAPTLEPVTLEEVKTRLGFGGTERDSELLQVIEAARRQAERETQRAFINQTWALYLDSFPGVIELRKLPVSSVTSIQYVDTADATQTFAATNYNTDLTHEPARIELDVGKSWPTTREEVKAVTVTFVAGYGAAVTAVPADAKMLIYLLCEKMFFGMHADPTLDSAIESLVWQLSWEAKL